MSRGVKQQKSSWGAMAMGYHQSSFSCKNRGQPVAAAAAESKNISNSKKKRGISISQSMTCAGSICSTKESSVLSSGSRSRRSSNTSSSSLKAPDNDALSVSAAAVSASSSFNSETTVPTTATTVSSSSSSALSSPLSSIGNGSRSFRATQIRKLSGCYYECHSALDPRSSLGAAMLSCANCDEVFVKAESLELYRATKYAVSELVAEDTSRNIVEIIFQSSWLKKPVCKIERILKVQSTGKTIERFEQYRERIKEKAASSDEAKKNYPRCVVDGNELLRFHCTTFTCSLGLAGGTALCRTSSSAPQCKLCGIIRDGFSVDGDGKISTMGTSGRAHDMALVSPDGGKRAMLVCRVVAGRVKKSVNGGNLFEDRGFDSVSSCSEGVYSDLDELCLFNPRATLPCFVVIYSGY